MPSSRAAGILLPLTSLPGSLGVGDLGTEAVEFLDFLERTGQIVWQVLPIGPTGWGNSPYQSPSAFAGNLLLISPRTLQEQGLLTKGDLEEVPAFPADRVDYEAVGDWRFRLLGRAFDRFTTRAGLPLRARHRAFCEQNRTWLDDYALFMALKKAHDGCEWTAWEPDLVRRKPRALAAAGKKLARQIEFRKFAQFLFFEQWGALREAARSRGVRIFGDIPIFVAHDSADVWAGQELFQLDEDGRPTVIAGVPPDYFSATGQRWGNPLYRWDVLAESDYAWWIRRLKWSFELYDLVRIDHFRGFEAYWEIPAEEETAVHGRWRPGPGAEFFKVVQRRLGNVDLVAEDLGLITPEVEALRDGFEFPGMRVLQFAFSEGEGPEGYRPYSYPRRCVVYTGTHDNDTTVGWFTQKPDPDGPRSPEDLQKEREFACRFAGTDGREIHWDFIRLAMSSVANLAIVPIQDVLGLGSEARMNTPGTGTGNWSWKLSPGQITAGAEQRLAEMTRLYGRWPRGRVEEGEPPQPIPLPKRRRKPGTPRPSQDVA